MAGLRNVSELRFQYQERRSVYQSQYQDQSGNLWSITVDGQAKDVKQFRRQLALQLSTEPLDPDEAKRLIEVAREESRNLPDEPEEEDALHKLLIEPPSLRMEYSLIKRVEQGPCRFKFVIDPQISKGWHQYSFYLNAYDSTANVTCRTQQGSVSYHLSALWQNWVRTSGTGNITLTHPRGNIRNWKIWAIWKSGAPAYYTLDGDMVIW